MDHSVRIVPFNFAKHSAPAQEIFKKAFTDTQEPDEALTQAIQATNTHVAVLEHMNKTAGFAIWEDQHVYINRAFSDVCKKNSPAILDVCRLHYLAIARTHRKTLKKRGKGFGTALLNYVTEQAKQNDQDIITLTAINDTPAFYAKNDFIKTFPRSRVNFMAKPLNEDIQNLLTGMIEKRNESTTRNVYYKLV
jgi:ribosomal protein S18 acetylase RimI-like enzyme